MPSNKDSMYDYAQSVYSSHAERFARVNEVQAVTRMRGKNEVTVNGAKFQVAQTGRALSVVTQFTAFAADVPVPYVPPKDNTQQEDEKTSKIEQWLTGMPRRLPFVGMHPYDAYLHNYAESGIGLLLLEFDDARAIRGVFPFRAKALPAESTAFQFGDDEIACVVWKETKQALGLYQDLVARYEASVKPKWNVPSGLEKEADENPTRLLEVTRMYTRDTQYYWIEQDRVWDMPLLCKEYGVPVDVGLCMPLPSAKPEDWAMGLVYPALGMYLNEQALLNKAGIGYEFFTFPLERVYYNDGSVIVRQTKPSAAPDENVVKIETVQAFPNYQSLELLANKFDVAIGRLTLQESTFGEGANTTSGYQVSLLNAGPMRRVQKMLGTKEGVTGAAFGLARHYTRLLRYVEHFANEEMARELGAKDTAKYLEAFATVTAPDANPEKKYASKIVLGSQDVAGYTDVLVDILPEMPEDKNAKYQRAKLAQEIGMSREGIVREILEVAQPDQELAWQREDLMAQDPMWQEFLVKKGIKDKLNRDKKLAAEFLEFLNSKANEQPEPQMSVQGDPPMQAPPPMMPPQMDALLPPQGMSPDMAGLPPEMMPPAQAGMLPVSPDEMEMQMQAMPPM